MASRNLSAPWSMQGGATVFTRHQAQRFARQLLESEDYRTWLQERITKRTLETPIEQMLWHYAYGKPTEQIQMTVSQGQEDLSTMPIEELQKRAQELNDKLKEALDLEAALPAQYKVG